VFNGTTGKTGTEAEDMIAVDKLLVAVELPCLGDSGYFICLDCALTKRRQRRIYDAGLIR
jgi:hypothetical protein